ncbi:MAG: MFS transporter [Armatimonadetes bacterium]|jgi:FSR family fosmidomycin resistance protein-like MFS transporter|nr:MFS transporter [Armatimonadota bacterium]
MTRWRGPRGDLLLLSLGHSVTDTYSNFLPGLIVFLTERLALTNTLVGLLATVVSVSGSMSQLLFGHAADRVRRHYFLVLGPVCAAIFMSLLGTAHSVPMLVLFLVLGGAGIASFHPQAAVAAGTGPASRRGFALAFFVTAGSAGYSVGPLVSTWTAERFGADRTWIAAFPGLLVALLLYLTVYRRLSAVPKGSATAAEEAAPALSSTPPPPPARLPRAILSLWAIVALRSAVSTGLVHFMPLFLQGRGATPVYGSLAVSLFLFAGAAGGMIGGALSDRWGRRRVLVISLAASTPLLFGLTLVPATAFLAVLVVAGLVLSASAAVNVAMAQEIAPERQGIASAIVQGFAFGTGGLLAVAAGALADRTSIGLVYQVLALLPLLTVPVALTLPETARRKG